MKGIVFDIQRFALHDGPGIRTTVFLKGCPLRCVWCHNPESWSFRPQLAYNAERCSPCMACVSACSRGAHAIRDGLHVFNHTACRVEGSCVPSCAEGALTIIGEEMSVARVMDEVLRDVPYYRRSGGGLTLSGGEPLAQFHFARVLLEAAKLAGLHTCLDTSGSCHLSRLEAVAENVDLFLFDYKATDPREHRKLTGVSNELILGNLDYLYSRGARIRLRCPLVPGVNDTPEHLAGIAALDARYPLIEGIEIMAYHNVGRDKAARVGYLNPLASLPSTDDATKAGWLRELHRRGCGKARIG